MKSITKRSIVIARDKTSVSLEDAFWNANFKEVAASRDMTLSQLVSAIVMQIRRHVSCCWLFASFVLDVYLDQLDRITKKESKRPIGVAR